ncbi:hypothetical protein GJQ54_04920 [Oceanospirillaceae bacterium ASx5O]|nr:hypothetical protein GJQ54_04920 [Oceanospirillaceae bacterium ASx5O]
MSAGPTGRRRTQRSVIFYPRSFIMNKTVLSAAIAIGSLVLASSAGAEELSQFISAGKATADLRLRYENNDTDNNLKTADALTLRSRLGLQSGRVNGFSALVEIDDIRALVDNYSPESPGYNLVADPEDTEFNRVQISWNNDKFSAVLGRQRILLDNTRFVGNVGWRQNEQTFDAVKFGYKTPVYQAQYAYINQVNDITFNDIDVSHHLINVNYSGFKPGSLTGYAYLLEDDATDTSNDTYGVRFSGKQAVNDLSVLYSAEYALQKTDNFDASYLALEGGVLVQGVTLALGYESLGSDDGAYGFQTPLATKHAFNGWADKFLNTPNDGLTDTYVKVATAVAGVNLLAFYHDYSSEQGSDDKGNEVNVQAGKNFGKYYSAGVKYAAYRKGDNGTDTDKAWLWLEAKF